MSALNFTVFGNPSNPPLIIIHGLFGSHDNLRTLGKKFSNAFYVILPDCRNHGESFHHKGMTYEQMASDIDVLINQMGLTNVNIIGHSMGGKIAMAMALQHQVKINKMVIIDIAPKQYELHYSYIIRALLNLDLNNYLNRQEIDNSLKHQIQSQQLRQFLLKNLRTTPSGLVWKFNLSAIQTNYKCISEFPVFSSAWNGKALFIRGTNSDYILDKDRIVINQFFPNAMIKSISTSHWVHAEKPIETYEMIRSFLD